MAETDYKNELEAGVTQGSISQAFSKELELPAPPVDAGWKETMETSAKRAQAVKAQQLESYIMHPVGYSANCYVGWDIGFIREVLKGIAEGDESTPAPIQRAEEGLIVSMCDVLDHLQPMTVPANLWAMSGQRQSSRELLTRPDSLPVLAQNVSRLNNYVKNEWKTKVDSPWAPMIDWLDNRLNDWQHGAAMRAFGARTALEQGGEQGRLALMYGITVSAVCLMVDFPRAGLDAMSVLVDGTHRMEALLEVTGYKGLPVLHCGRVIEQAARLPRCVVSALHHGTAVPEWFSPQRHRERMALQIMLNHARPLKTLGDAECHMIQFGQHQGRSLGGLAGSGNRKDRYWLNWLDQQDLLNLSLRDSLDVLFEQHPKLQPAKFARDSQVSFGSQRVRT